MRLGALGRRPASTCLSREPQPLEARRDPPLGVTQGAQLCDEALIGRRKPHLTHLSVWDDLHTRRHHLLLQRSRMIVPAHKHAHGYPVGSGVEPHQFGLKGAEVVLLFLQVVSGGGLSPYRASERMGGHSPRGPRYGITTK